MKADNYITTRIMTGINSLQNAKSITYSVTCENDGSSIIKVTQADAGRETFDEFKCRSSFADCIGLVNFLKENCICPEHCRDISVDLGYNICQAVR